MKTYFFNAAVHKEDGETFACGVIEVTNLPSPNEIFDAIIDEIRKKEGIKKENINIKQFYKVE